MIIDLNFVRSFNAKKYIISRIKIIDVIKEYTSLAKYSKNYFIGMCPFNDCNKDTFRINHKLKIFKCSTCERSGSIFKFLEKILNKTYPDIYDYILKKYKKFIPKSHYNFLVLHGKDCIFRYKLLEVPFTLDIPKNPMRRNSGTTLRMRRYKQSAEKIINKYEKTFKALSDT